MGSQELNTTQCYLSFFSLLTGIKRVSITMSVHRCSVDFLTSGVRVGEERQKTLPIQTLQYITSRFPDILWHTSPSIIETLSKFKENNKQRKGHHITAKQVRENSCQCQAKLDPIKGRKYQARLRLLIGFKTAGGAFPQKPRYPERKQSNSITQRPFQPRFPLTSWVVNTYSWAQKSGIWVMICETLEQAPEKSQKLNL